MAWLYIPAEIGERITALCNARYKIEGCDCPLRAVCDRPNDPNKTSADNTRAWEQDMASALTAHEGRSAQ